MFSKLPKTKLKTITQFINLYGGPEVVIHFRYSFIMNLIFVAFTYGLAIPMLFPITMFGIFNMYVCERLMMAYYYRQPP